MDLFCCICLHHIQLGDGHAQTIINGQAVCLDHAGYVQGGSDFNRALSLAKSQEK
jgi:hypothetical protein